MAAREVIGGVWLIDTFRGPVQQGQEACEFRRSIPAQTVTEALSACYCDTLHRWLQARQGDSAPFALRPVLRAKLDLILDGLTAR
ncbi:hypothetical protein ABZ656_44800 [Streptomyces sp. NPDC007095]|uniref:hypothetical protein n=1 Tax=Streptomyces sp. NPDC007095 TaxID=3154482 RepID=UPI0033CCACB1